MMEKIELGDKVKCIYTGFTGFVVAKTEFINGCVQFSVVPKVGKSGEMPEEIGIDIESLKIIQKGKKKKTDDDPGGANRIAPKQRGF